jgi:hypothetical protein
MVRDTSVSNGYFRNPIRDSLKQPTERRGVKFCYQGQEIVGTEVVLTPLVVDPNIDKLKRYAYKRYEFTFSDQITGGGYRIHIEVPSEDANSDFIAN